MKIKILAIVFLFSMALHAQKVDVYDLQWNKLNKAPVEKNEVPDHLHSASDGDYYIIEIKAVRINGTYYFKKCRYRKMVTQPQLLKV